MSKRILTITMNPALDVSSETEEVLTDQKVRCEKPTYDPGGGGINVARVLSRLKIPADAQFIAGGITGDYLRTLLQQEKVNDVPIQIKEATRESVSVLDNKSGKQYRFVFPGPHIKKDIWEKVLKNVEQNISSYNYVVASGSLPPGVPVDFYSRLAKIVLGNGKSYLLDTSGDALSEGIKNGASFIKPNEEEFNELIKQTDSADENELIEKLYSLGIENIIHTLGKEGTYLYNREGKKKFNPPEIKVKSSIGAGDSFVGGLVGGLASEMNVEDAVCYGISAAASTLQSPGTSLCNLNEVQEIHADLCGKVV
ncbi:MAG: 1-phosphofructokinase family hexose kinase [Balneolaceae bacterium]